MVYNHDPASIDSEEYGGDDSVEPACSHWEPSVTMILVESFPLIIVRLPDICDGDGGSDHVTKSPKQPRIVQSRAAEQA